jgi:DNA-binding transcriptional regulator YiaG
MKAKLIVGGVEIELTEQEYRRMVNNTRPDPRYYNFPDGKIVTMNFDAIVPIETAENAEEVAVTTQAQEGAAPVDDLMDAGAATEPAGDQADKITADDIKDILKSQDLTQKDFAAKIGYSPSAVRMAVQEGRISDEFSQKVLEVFKPVESEDAEG